MFTFHKYMFLLFFTLYMHHKSNCMQKNIENNKHMSIIIKINENDIYTLNHNTLEKQIFSDVFINSLKINNINLIEKFTYKKLHDDIYMFKIFNNSNVEIYDLNCMFNLKKNIIQIEGIENIIDISKVNDIGYMFEGCVSLINLKGLEKWNVKNITYMEGLFKNCKSLISIPDISNWNIKKLKSLNNLFSGCSSLSSIPDISKWDTSNIENMYCIFNDCISLTSLPNISKWNIKKVEDIYRFFGNCISLCSLPDFSKWNTDSILINFQMYNGSFSILNMYNIKNIHNIGSCCIFI